MAHRMCVTDLPSGVCAKRSETERRTLERRPLEGVHECGTTTHEYTTHQSAEAERRVLDYGAEAVDTGGKWRTTCWSRTSSPALGHKSCVVAALIARAVSCSDFRLQ